MTNDRFPSQAAACGTVDRADVSPAAEKAGVPALGLYGVLTAVFEAAAGALRDRATRRRLSLESDRVLADMGFSRETLAAELAAARTEAAARRGALISQRLAAWRAERRIRGELSRCTDAELNELGIFRADIPAVSRGHAMLMFRDAGLVDGFFATDGAHVAANLAAPRRAA